LRQLLHSCMTKRYNDNRLLALLIFFVGAGQVDSWKGTALCPRDAWFPPPSLLLLEPLGGLVRCLEERRLRISKDGRRGALVSSNSGPSLDVWGHAPEISFLCAVGSVQLEAIQRNTFVEFVGASPSAKNRVAHSFSHGHIYRDQHEQ
jgi:hypothetical protein